MRHRLIGSLTLTGLILTAVPAAAQGVPDYGLDWMTVGEPGNRGANKEEAPGFQPPNWRVVGAVDHTFRLTRTELKVNQWFEFVEAYSPFWEGSPGDSRFTGLYITYSNNNGYRIVPGAENFPTEMSWRVAARYANWLHNDKNPEQWAFETGVYDTSTFHTNDDGTFTDQTDPSPGARFWIPTVDEMIKGTFYDPNRYGQGEGGYWKQPGSSDVPLISNWPYNGGETNAGDFFGGLFDMDAASYPWAQTPWGLLDASGGVGEWTTTRLGEQDIFARRSRAGWPSHERWDVIDKFSQQRPNVGGLGLRLASLPTPGVFTTIAIGAVVLLSGRNRR